MNSPLLSTVLLAWDERVTVGWLEQGREGGIVGWLVSWGLQVVCFVLYHVMGQSLYV